MTLWCIIPAKPFEEAKSRLAAHLAPAARETLARALFRRTCRVVGEFAGGNPVLVVTRSEPILAEAGAIGLLSLHEGDQPDINAALVTAATYALTRNASSVLAISADLPLLEADDLAAMAANQTAPAIAPDRHGSGSNALLWHGPGVAPYCFGPDSLARHLPAMAAAGAHPEIVHRLGLAMDIDTVSDLNHLRRIQEHGDMLEGALR